MAIDLNNFRGMVDDLECSEEEEMELIKAMFFVMETIIDDPHGFHPVHLCKQELRRDALQNSLESLESGHNPLKVSFEEKSDNRSFASE